MNLASPNLGLTFGIEPLLIEDKSYVLDSAIHYLNKGIEFDTKLNDTFKIYSNKINLTKLLGSSTLS